MTYDETPDEFDAFENSGGIIAFVFHKYGVDGLRQLLAMDTEDAFTRESLEDAANELAALDLSKAAEIVAEVAVTKPSELDLNPYPADTTDGRAWLANVRWRLKRRRRSNFRRPMQ